MKLDIEKLVKKLKHKDPFAWIVTSLFSFLLLVIVLTILNNIIPILLIGGIIFLGYYKMRGIK